MFVLLSDLSFHFLFQLSLLCLLLSTIQVVNTHTVEMESNYSLIIDTTSETPLPQAPLSSSSISRTPTVQCPWEDETASEEGVHHRHACQAKKTKSPAHLTGGFRSARQFLQPETMHPPLPCTPILFCNARIWAIGAFLSRYHALHESSE